MNSSTWALDAGIVCVRPTGLRVEPASNRYTIDVVHIEFHSGCAERIVFDEDAVDNCLNDPISISITDFGHGLVELCIHVIVMGILCSLEHEVAHVFNWRVGGIFGSLSNVVERLVISGALHQE